MVPLRSIGVEMTSVSSVMPPSFMYAKGDFPLDIDIDCLFFPLARAIIDNVSTKLKIVEYEN